MADFSLRPAVEADAPEIRSLIARVNINPINLDWRHFVIAETHNGELIGCGQLKPHNDGSLTLASIAVDESHRGQGVARAIIEHLLAQGPRPLYLMCRSGLGSFYKKFGFRIIEWDEAPPHLLRLRWLVYLVRGVYFVLRREKPLVMRLD